MENKILQHSHGDARRFFADCPRCQQLLAKPYILTYKLACHKKIQKLAVRNTREAIDLIAQQLPAVSLRVPVVTTPSGEVVSILRYS